MKLTDYYKNDSLIQAIGESIKPNSFESIQLKGLSGSLDAVVLSSIYQINHQNHLVILHDKEEAAYFLNDLQSCLGIKEIFLFPSSFKRPYQVEEIENANVLMRAEILNRINNRSTKGEIIVTYPSALSEKVINKRSLIQSTLKMKMGSELDLTELKNQLISFGFELSDFVYEVGQFSIRGGIIDIFSYANELPYRIELFGNEVDSLRTFDPSNQLSQDRIKEVSIIPNIQTQLQHESRESFLHYIPNNTKIWFKDFGNTCDTIDLLFQKAIEEYDGMASNNGETLIISKPVNLFETSESFKKMIGDKVTIEFGNRFHFKSSRVFTFNSQPQPSFNKNFEILVNDLLENQSKNINNFITAESPSQIDRLEEIFSEIDSRIEFTPIHIGLREGFKDLEMKIACYTDHQIFERFHRFQTKNKFSKSKAITLKELKSLSPGDYVTHIDHGIGRFAGLEKVDVGGKKQEAIRLVYKDDDLLFLSVHSIHKISRYSGKEGAPPSISKLGSQEWENKKKRVKKKVIDIATDLINLYAKRKQTVGFKFSVDSFLQAELESSFIYEDTPDQARATSEVKKDLEEPHPMDRLVCGDVGFGKTEIAIRAAFKAVTDNKQVAILVPTTILAMQHYRTFSERLSNFPVNINYVNRFKSVKKIKEILKEVASGKLDVLIGTHRMVNKDMAFKDLGLLVIDEEQKFGVKVKERIKEIKVNVDVLTLTATPIPRTLHFSLMGARDLSVISTPPPNRQPVTTEIHQFDQKLIRDAINFELKRGGQVFFVHNRIFDIEEVANIVLKLVPEARIGVAHGQMEGSRLEKVMIRFIEGEYDVLVSTNIIESGLDIPNANTIIINHAHMFGLSDLHQMRGRVGRSNRKAFCYLLSPPTIGLTPDARKRLATLEEFSELGDGFKVAMRDLDIRGAGNLLGSEQSGFINDLGFDTYHKILDDAIQELKESTFKDLFNKEIGTAPKQIVQDCVIETDLEIIIPEDYVSNISERLSLYSQLDNIKEDEDLKLFIDGVVDRFGPLPDSVKELVESVRLRWLGEKLGFEKLVLKNESIKGYFVPKENESYYKSEIFGSILNYVQRNGNYCKMHEKKNKLILTIGEILSVNDAEKHLLSMSL